MKLRIIILIDWFLPGNKAGGPVKSVYSLVKILQDVIDFYIITMNTDITSNKEYSIPPNQWTSYEGTNIYYFSNNKFSCTQLQKIIHEINPNVIYINSFWSYRFSILPLILKKLKKMNFPIVLAPRGMLEIGAMSVKSFKKNIFIFLSKIIRLHKNIIFHATSPEEDKSIQTLYPSGKIIQIPNLSYIETHFTSIKKERNHLKLFFLSRVNSIKNLDFAINILSKINIPASYKIEYDIYGNNEDKQYFKYCKSLTLSLPETIKVTYKGIVNFKDIPKIISEYHFLFLPTKNENFGHAIIETLSCGRPVIISNCTPWNNINFNRCGYALPLDENNFIHHIKKILEMDDIEFQTMCLNAKKFIQETLNVSQIKEKYLNMFEYAAKS